MAQNQQSSDREDLAFQYRRAVANAYAYVAGQQAVQTFSAVTFEDLAARQIDRISGKGTPQRGSYISRIQKVEADLTAVATQIKAEPPDAFLDPDTSRDVNTPA